MADHSAPPASLPGGGWVPRVAGRGLTPVAAVGLVMVLVCALLLAGLWWWQSRVRPAELPSVLTRGPAVAPTGGPMPTSSPGPAPRPLVVVHVVGLVVRPGVVRLPEGSRVADAIRAAGGLRRDARGIRLNLARRLVDGEQVVVARGVVAAGPGQGVADVPASSSSGGVDAPLDLNSATLEQLESLPGVGPVLAGRIVEWRVAHGRFSSVEELGEVTGVGDKTLANLAPRLRV